MELEQDLALAFAEAHPADAARYLEGIASGPSSRFVDSLPVPLAAAVLQAGAPHFAAAALEAAAPERAAQLAAHLPADVAAGLLRRMEEPARERVLAALPDGSRAPVTKLITFAPQTAGAHVDPGVLTLTPDITAGEALDRVAGAPGRALDELFVLDRADKLLGVVKVREVAATDRSTPVSALMQTAVTSIRADASVIEAVSHPSWQQHRCLPVVDARGVFQGVVRYRTFRALEASMGTADDASDPTFRALGEVLRAGVGGMLDAFSASSRPIAGRDR